MTVIDAHSHFVPDNLVELIRDGAHPNMHVEDRGGHACIVDKGGFQCQLDPRFHDPEAMLAQMDKDGIDVSLISIAAPLFFYELEPDAAIAFSRAVNDGAAELAAQSGGRLQAMATIPMIAPEAAAEELRRATGELGLKGVEIATSVEGRTLDAPEFEPVWVAAEETRTPLLVHPYRSMMGDDLPAGFDRFFMANSVGNPFETHAAAARLILGGVLDRHPDLLFQLSHGGGNFPYQVGRMAKTYRERAEAREVAARPPHDYLDNFLFDTVIYDIRALDFLISLVGPERVVFGTDSPFEMADLTGLGLRERLPEEDARRVVCGNAMDAYGLL